jgi:purine-binding chemotaxis protein CheW
MAVTAYGLLRLGEARIAVPVAGLRDVVPAPARLARPLLRQHHIAGLMDDRGAAVPVLDRRYLEGEAAAGTAAWIAVLGTPEGLLGLQIDGVAGIVRVADDRIQHVAQGGQGPPPPFPALLRQPGDGTLVPVLDPRALMQAPGVVFLVTGAGAAPPNRAPRRHFAFTFGELSLSVDALAVLGVAARPAAARDSIAFRGRRVPVADLAALLGVANQATGFVVVVEQGGCAVALPACRLEGMRPATQGAAPPGAQAAATLSPPPRHPAGPAPEILPTFGPTSSPTSGPISSPAPRAMPVWAMQLDIAALLRTPAVAAALAALDSAGAPGRAASDAPPAPPAPAARCLAFTAGKPFRVRLEQIEAVLPVAPAQGPGRQGLIAYRGAMLPLLPGHAVLGEPGEAGPPSHALVVRGAEGPAAIMVESVTTLARLPANAGAPLTDLAAHVSAWLARTGERPQSLATARRKPARPSETGAAPAP